MHFYEGHFGGMHLIWWIIWIILLAWIFFIPTNLILNDIFKRRHFLIITLVIKLKSELIVRVININPLINAIVTLL